ncbi:MAG: ABC transporter permease, partial [Acidimicrobiia bacterium]|nr:ABC transporter permease [Acidimicrobiia bacterium]
MTDRTPSEVQAPDGGGRRDPLSMLFQPGAWRIEKRLAVRPWHEFVALVAALLVAVAIIAGLVLVIGKSPADSFAALYNGAFGNWESTLETLVQATPLILTGLAAAIAFRAGVWNIGAEGQFFAGVMGTWFVYDMWGGLPAPLLFVLMFIFAAIAGALWSSVASGLLVRYGTNEILTTVMLNFVILYILSYLLAGPWQSPDTYYYQTVRMADSTYLPRFLTGSRLHWGFAIALLAALAVYWIIRRTTLGYEIRGIG